MHAILSRNHSARHPGLRLAEALRDGLTDLQAEQISEVACARIDRELSSAVVQCRIRPTGKVMEGHRTTEHCH